jgi:O-antigen/teichoic acid export membrane protein
MTCTGGAPSIGLGSQAARGAAVLLTARVVLGALALVQSVVIARAVTPRELGLYAMALALVSVVSRLKQIGSAEKLVRDPEEELPASFAAALAIEIAASLAAIVVLAAGAALVPWRGADPKARVVIALLGVMLLQTAAELPAALLHRRLEFRRLAVKRLCSGLAAVIATIASALLGLQVWSLVVGQVVGVVGGGVLFWRGVEPRPRSRLERSAIVAYLSFGLPLWGSGLLYTLAERGSVLVVSSVLGLSTLGYVHLAQALTARLAQASDAMNAGIYPALRAMAADPGALRNVLERTSRVFALGGVPVGVALALFAGEWVPLFLGTAWKPAVPYVSVYCLTWGLSTIGYPCYLAFQARGDTRTLFVFGSLSFLGRFVAVASGVILFGEPGLLVAVACGVAINIAARLAMIRRMFPDFSLLALSARPVLVTAAAVASARLAEMVFSAGGIALPVGFIVFVGAAVAGAFTFDRATMNDAAVQVVGAFRGLAAR